MHDRFCRSIRSNFLFLPCLLHGFKIGKITCHSWKMMAEITELKKFLLSPSLAIPARKEDVSTRKTVQIDSFDAKFLDINTLSKLIYERKSFVIENVSDVSETVKRVEHEIEKRKLSCRVYTEYRSTALAGSLWSPTVIWEWRVQ